MARSLKQHGHDRQACWMLIAAPKEPGRVSLIPARARDTGWSRNMFRDRAGYPSTARHCVPWYASDSVLIIHCRPGRINWRCDLPSTVAAGIA